MPRKTLAERRQREALREQTAPAALAEAIRRLADALLDAARRMKNEEVPQ